MTWPWSLSQSVSSLWNNVTPCCSPLCRTIFTWIANFITPQWHCRKCGWPHTQKTIAYKCSWIMSAPSQEMLEYHLWSTFVVNMTTWSTDNAFTRLGSSQAFTAPTGITYEAIMVFRWSVPMPGLSMTITGSLPGMLTPGMHSGSAPLSPADLAAQ